MFSFGSGGWAPRPAWTQRTRAPPQWRKMLDCSTIKTNGRHPLASIGVTPSCVVSFLHYRKKGLVSMITKFAPGSIILWPCHLPLSSAGWAILAHTESGKATSPCAALVTGGRGWGRGELAWDPLVWGGEGHHPPSSCQQAAAVRPSPGGVVSAPGLHWCRK